MANLPYVISGTLYDTNGTTTLSNIKVSLRNERSNTTISTTSASNGQYALDCANFSNGYVDGDTITLFVIYTNFEDYEERQISESQGGETVNLTLTVVPASDELRYFTVQQFYDFHHFAANSGLVPTTKEVVTVGVQVEKDIDETCGTRWSSSNVEISVDTCDATTGWGASTDATAIATDTTTFRTRTASLKLGKSGTTEAFFYYNKGVTNRSFQDRIVGCFVYFSSLTGLATTGTAVKIKYGSDSSNYYSKDWYKDDLVADWNFLSFSKDDPDVTETGNVDDVNCDFFEIYVTTTATTTTFTSGTVLLDNVFLVHRDHYGDDYIDTENSFIRDYYIDKIPITRLVQFQANLASDVNSDTWQDLTVEDEEIEYDSHTGRITIRNLTDDVETLKPVVGVRQVRATYLYGANTVPKDIQKLAVLMTSRDLMQSAVSRALINGQDSFRSEHYTVFDAQIDRILARHRKYDMFNT